MDREQPVFSLETLDQSLSDSLASRQFNMRLFVMFAVLGLALAGVGVYGVTSHSVGQRTHEIGLRMALGASRRDVLRLVVGHGMVLTLIGSAVGFGCSLWLTSLLEGMLFDVKPNDPLTFAAVSAILAFVAVLASFIPAHRATRVDPLVALRHE